MDIYDEMILEQQERTELLGVNNRSSLKKFDIVYEDATLMEELETGVKPNLDVDITRYGSRNWAVYVNKDLLAVTVYLKGAHAIKTLIENLSNR